MALTIRDYELNEKKEEYKDKCWSYNGKYMGRLLKQSIVGRPYDPDWEIVFEHGTVIGIGASFTEVPPRSPKQE
jgi:hypothetical protein